MGLWTPVVEKNHMRRLYLREWDFPRNSCWISMIKILKKYFFLASKVTTLSYYLIIRNLLYHDTYLPKWIVKANTKFIILPRKPVYVFNTGGEINTFILKTIILMFTKMLYVVLTYINPVKELIIVSSYFSSSLIFSFIAVILSTKIFLE